MHFLDGVFVLQWPMYKSTVIQGGRGWLLSTLLRIGPFYHAALATSLHHQQILMSESTNPSQSCKATALVKQGQHLEVSIKSVTKHAQSAHLELGLDIMMAVIQLVFFEVLLPCRLVA